MLARRYWHSVRARKDNANVPDSTGKVPGTTSLPFFN
jgi:hypothetical protein